ncbi:MAG: hypothetical protein U1E22_02580 [Coriobacteriia bacterium]|nr:hypothetical protein [Coriobacteriia bacterium]
MISPVAREVVAFGRELEAQGAAQAGITFTDNPEANGLIEESPEAFLLGMLFTQGISAERAWAGPYLLRMRLGHLDLTRLAEEPDAVRAAIQAAPMLHRFKNTIPRWISSAARKLLQEYGGDASRIWARGSHVLEVTERLSAFDGIGRKKAVMAVEILQRHFGAELAGREFGAVAYDVHVRRVFLRSGLVAHDTVAEVEAAAAGACPESPGTVDLAAWLIGRETCRPRAPRCDDCRLGGVCPRLTWLMVEGVGARVGRRT